MSGFCPWWACQGFAVGSCSAGLGLHHAHGPSRVFSNLPSQLFQNQPFHFLPFSRKCWPDNAASKPLGPRHPTARPMRCDTLSLTRVSPRWRLLAPGCSRETPSLCGEPPRSPVHTSGRPRSPAHGDAAPGAWGERFWEPGLCGRDRVGVFVPARGGSRGRGARPFRLKGC